MLSKFLATTALGAALIAMPALAQTKTSPAPSSPSTTNQTAPAPSSPSAKKDDTSASNTQTASSAGLWQGSKLIGLNVYNDKNEKIGSIVQLMVDKKGSIESVVIGVGGFLGMGERDVAVKFSELKFSDQPVPSSSSSSSNSRSGTTGAGSTSGTKSGPMTYPDHAVFNATKEQLKAMPQFDYNK